ncbi:hypothetical protein GCM10009668_31700 [Nocardioides dubius]|uniref:Uncharacterized protein n=1 Tax=Nocardioides dubius TaxID=317019 RepID=A0ABN1TZ10_9ACTN
MSNIKKPWTTNERLVMPICAASARTQQATAARTTQAHVARVGVHAAHAATGADFGTSGTQHWRPPTR